RDSKLTMLLRESLGNMNCRTTMIAHISAAAGNYAETLSTIQIASRVLRMKKKKTKYTSSSSGGESSCEEGRMRRPTQLRPFHSRNTVDPDFPILHLSSDPDYSSSSEQSCDTVIYVGPNGTALSDKELTDNEGPPDFVPIVPALQKTKNEGRLEEVSESGPSTSERDCLKCNTFAELQERLDCIDGSEETDKFPFEEMPAQFSSEQMSKCSVSSQLAELSQLPESDKEDTMPECQPPDREPKENINATPSKTKRNHSPVPFGALTNVSTPSSPRSVTGSSSKELSSCQLAHSTSLQSSREGLNTCGFVEGKPRPMGSPRLGIASLSKTSEYKPPTSSSQRCKVYTQKGVLPSSTPPPTPLSKDAGMTSSESLLQPEIRTPPVGMSPQIMKKLVSSSNGDFEETILNEDRQQSTSPESKKEILSTTMVTVQQPLELNGEDELVFTLVEELTISGVLDNGRPTSIISFNSDCSVQALASGSRPVSIISSISEDLECYSGAAPMSEVSITQFLPLPKLGLDDKSQDDGSRRSSISSWLSEMSTGSDGEQSCHSFIAQACYGHGEAMAEPPVNDFSSTIQSASMICVSDKQKPVTDNMLILSEMGEEAFGKVPPIKGCKISALGKTTVTIKNTASLSSYEGYIPMKTNITVYPCIAVNPFKAQDTDDAVPAVTAGPKVARLHDGKESSAKKDIKFEDPWLKREEDVKTNSSGSSDGPKSDTAAVSAKPEHSTKLSSVERLSSSSGDASVSPGSDNLKRIVDGCEVAVSNSATQSPVHSSDGLKNGSLDKKMASPKHCVLTRPKGTPPLPPVRKSSLDQKNRASPQHSAARRTTSSPSSQPGPFLASFPEELNAKQKGPGIDSSSNNSSSKLFSAKLEQLASRTNSLGRSTGSHYECLSLERAESLSSVSSKMSPGKDTTMPRAGRSLSRSVMSSPTNSGLSQSAGASPKASQSKISAVSKLLLASPKARSLSASATKTLSFSTKSLPQSVGQSSSLPPSGKNMNRGSSLASKLPLRAVNGRISELLQGSAGARGLQLRGSSEADERGGLPGDEKPAVHMLPSPYSKITPPRKPHRCSSGHGSDNSSVLSGELPPAMGKTALFYHSGGSSGYESMMRDSEATGSASSAQDSMSENSSSASGRCRSLKNPKKRSNAGSQRRRLIPALSLDSTSPARKPANSPGVRWVDGPLRSGQRGLGEPFEIKVYEIDDVERLQRRRGGDSKEVICFNAKLKILEHRQQRIAEVKAKYEWLMRELEVTKQYLMLDPNKWLSEFDLEQVFELDSLEYLEALECVTERLENRVNFCKAHLMMITCFDITSRRR
ncbi:Kinesin-like KIF26B, partial [Merops nubicus]